MDEQSLGDNSFAAVVERLTAARAGRAVYAHDHARQLAHFDRLLRGRRLALASLRRLRRHARRPARAGRRRHDVERVSGVHIAQCWLFSELQFRSSLSHGGEVSSLVDLSSTTRRNVDSASVLRFQPSHWSASLVLLSRNLERDTPSDANYIARASCRPLSTRAG